MKCNPPPAGQRDQVRRRAHNLKGAALTLGFSALGGACSGLEQQALSADAELEEEAEQAAALFNATRRACVESGYLADLDAPALRSD